MSQGTRVRDTEKDKACVVGPLSVKVYRWVSEWGNHGDGVEYVRHPVWWDSSSTSQKDRRGRRNEG